MIRDKHIFQEIPSPDTVVKMSEPPMFILIYKAIYMCLRVLVDIRNNTIIKKPSKVKVKNTIKHVDGNTVIKSTDIIKE